MSQNGQTHFKNLAAFADHFGTLCIKALRMWADQILIFLSKYHLLRFKFKLARKTWFAHEIELIFWKYSCKSTYVNI